MQFHVNAFGATDDGAIERRMSVREAHLQNARASYRSGVLLMGGAILDDKGKMIGSGLFIDIANRAALNIWLEQDPYSKGDVWQHFDITEVKLANLE